MPLIYAGPDEHGIIWIIDQKPDKTVVMLACSPGPSHASGVVPDAESDEQVYPMFEAADSAVLLDVTHLRPGLQRFESSTFLDRAAEQARGHNRVYLDNNSAEDWGFIEADGELEREF